VRGDFVAADFLPAGGQGIIALQVRAGADNATAAVRAINDAAAFSCLEAEREFLRLLQGDCGSPVGVLATISGSIMSVAPRCLNRRALHREAHELTVTGQRRRNWRGNYGRRLMAEKTKTGNVSWSAPGRAISGW
jgi:Porphobilinogen deaminase